MVLGAHAIIGGAIGVVVRGNPILAFVYGFISHFLLDMLPHWDYPIRSAIAPGKEGKPFSATDLAKDLISLSIDIGLGMGVAFFLWGSNGDLTYTWMWGAFGAMLPDALQFAYVLWKKPFALLQKIHEGVHTEYKMKNAPIAGVIIQVIVVVVVTGFLAKINLEEIDQYFNPEVQMASAGLAQAGLFDHKNSSTTIAFVGDIMLGRNVEKLYEEKGDNYPFLLVKDFLAKFNYVIGNLEGPIHANHVETPIGEMSFSFSPRVTSILSQAGIDAVSLANNHTFDKGGEYYDETIAYLKHDSIGSFGHPVNESRSTYVIQAGDYDIYLLGFNSTFPTFVQKEAASIVKEIHESSARARVFVFMHWGDEYMLKHNTSQRSIAEELIASGASLVIGAHPHVTQDIEVINGVPVVYSLGNFVFDQYFSEEVEKGLLTAVEIGNDGNSILKFYPIQSKRSQPYLADRDLQTYPDLYFSLK